MRTSFSSFSYPEGKQKRLLTCFKKGMSHDSGIRLQRIRKMGVRVRFHRGLVSQMQHLIIQLWCDRLCQFSRLCQGN